MRSGLLEILLLALLTGPSFLFMKIAVQEITPITLVCLRLGIAGILLLALLKLRNYKLSYNKKLWSHCFVLGIILNGLPFVCYSFALTHIPSSLSALINGLVPVLTVFLANAFLEDEKLTLGRIMGVLLGLSGFFVLFIPNLLEDKTGFDTAGILLCFLGTLCYAMGAIYTRKFIKQAPPLVVPTLQLLTPLIYLVPFAFIFESPLILKDASFEAYTALLGISILGTLFATILYHRIIVKQGATLLSMSMYLLPIFGAVLGTFFLDEIITIRFIFASLLILAGIGFVNGNMNFKLRKLKPSNL